MATIPTGYDITGLSPKIEILDENDSVQYLYESDAISSSPTQDYDLELWSLHRGVNTDHGNAVIVIDDLNKDLLDLTDARRGSKIDPTWKCNISLGKNSSNVNKWFNGFILGIDTIFPNTVETKHRLFVVGEGVLSAYYKTTMKFFQKKLADGTLDKTDVDAKFTEIFKRLILNTDHHPIPTQPLGWTVNGVQDIDIKIPDFQKNFESIGQACSELGSMGSAYYGIDLGDAYLRRRDSVDSGFLVTNMDWNSVIKTNWNQDNICYLLGNFSRGWTNDFSEYGIPFFNALNTQKPLIDKSQTTSNASLNLSSNHFSFPITPSVDNILKVAALLAKVGTIVKDLTMKILADDGTGKPNGSAILATKIIKGTTLQNELTASKYFEVLFNKLAISPGTMIHCTFDKYLDATNYITLDYQTLTGTYHDSTDGITWTAQTGDVKFREYSSKTTHVLCENTVASKQYPTMKRQMNIPMGNFDSIDLALVKLAGIAESRGKQRRRYPSFLVSAPTNPLGLAKTLRFHDIRSGLEFSPNLISYDLGGSAYSKQNNLGATEMALSIEEWGH